MDKNGYFVFEEKADGLYVNVYPPVGNGELLSMETVMYVMDKKGISNVELKDIKNAILTRKLQCVRICEKGIFSTREWMDLKTSKDNMLLVASFFPPFVGGELMTYDEIMKDLAFRKINYGINEKVIQQFINERDYGRKYIIAQGRKAVEGTDASITYLFETDKKAMPKLREDGTVDFYDLDNITHVKQGDVVAKITKEIQGIPGSDIFGNIIKPHAVSKKSFRYGRNLVVSSDGLSLISEINGHIMLDGDRVSVSNTYEVASNVDLSTGNIDYDGNVVVSGNVISGFTIKASGNIEVKGVVEGATLIAGESVILGRGVQGMQQAVIRAEKDVIAKFIENTKLVEAKGKVESGAIIQSKIMAGDQVIVQGKNGIIIGGKVVAKRMILAKNVGTEMGTTTSISVGISPAVKVRSEELKKEIKSFNDEKEKLTTIIVTLLKKHETSKLDAAKIDLLKRTQESLRNITEKLDKSVSEYNYIQNEIREANDACIKVEKNIYQGVNVSIGESEIHIKEKFSYCKFIKSGAEIIRKPLA